MSTDPEDELEDLTDAQREVDAYLDHLTKILGLPQDVKRIWQDLGPRTRGRAVDSKTVQLDPQLLSDYARAVGDADHNERLRQAGSTWIHELVHVLCFLSTHDNQLRVTGGSGHPPGVFCALLAMSFCSGRAESESHPQPGRGARGGRGPPAGGAPRPRSAHAPAVPS